MHPAICLLWVTPDENCIFSPRSGSGREERLARSDAGSGVEMDEEEYETIDKVGEEKLINWVLKRYGLTEFMQAEQSRESGEADSD